MTDNAIRPFRVNVPEAELTELRRRIKNMARIGARQEARARSGSEG